MFNKNNSYKSCWTRTANVSKNWFRLALDWIRIISGYIKVRWKITKYQNLSTAKSFKIEMKLFLNIFLISSVASVQPSFSDGEG